MCICRHVVSHIYTERMYMLVSTSTYANTDIWLISVFLCYCQSFSLFNSVYILNKAGSLLYVQDYADIPKVLYSMELQYCMLTYIYIYI